MGILLLKRIIRFDKIGSIMMISRDLEREREREKKIGGRRRYFAMERGGGGERESEIKIGGGGNNDITRFSAFVSKKANHPKILRVLILPPTPYVFISGPGRKKQRAIDRTNETPFSGPHVHVT